MADPARAQKLPLRERVRVARQVCREVPCANVRSGNPRCPFCPHWARVLREAEA